MILSYSHIQTYERCPRRYKFAYVEKIPQPLSKSLSFGTSLHNTLYKFLTIYQKIKQEQQQHSLFDPAPVPPGYQTLLSCLDESWLETGYSSAEEMYTRKQEAMRILQEFFDSLGTPSILHLEKSFTVEVGNTGIKGRYDRVDTTGENTLEIMDYKTGKLRTEQECQDDMQLPLYHLALQKQYPKHHITSTLYFLEHNTKISVSHTSETLEQASRRLNTIGNHIEQGIFEPTPKEDICRSCPYNKICSAAV